ncbi:hypothetical protein PG993_004332 [Apiospora rasikravindrae]|uniref:Uncharacterized protein n=1 Tax=Apiospora rasikravindrae TaxID=990691 RepID=A0ABR1TCG1_9PEZI
MVFTAHPAEAVPTAPSSGLLVSIAREGVEDHPVNELKEVLNPHAKEASERLGLSRNVGVGSAFKSSIEKAAAGRCASLQLGKVEMTGLFKPL